MQLQYPRNDCVQSGNPDLAVVSGFVGVILRGGIAPPVAHDAGYSRLSALQGCQIVLIYDPLD